MIVLDFLDLFMLSFSQGLGQSALVKYYLHGLFVIIGNIYYMIYTTNYYSIFYEISLAIDYMLCHHSVYFYV